MISKAATIANIKECMKQLQKAYQESTEASWNGKVATLKPHEQVPAKNCFYDDGNRETYNARCRELQSAALDAVKKYHDSINVDVTAAPSEEAVRALQTFSMLPPGTLPSKTDYQRRVQALADKYGSNALFMESLKGLAAQQDVHIASHPAVQAYDDAETMKNTVNRFFDNRVVLAGSQKPASEVSDASIAFMFSDFANAAIGFKAED